MRAGNLQFLGEVGTLVGEFPLPAAVENGHRVIGSHRLMLNILTAQVEQCRLLVDLEVFLGLRGTAQGGLDAAGHPTDDDSGHEIWCW